MKKLTMNYEKKKEANQDKLDQILKSLFPLLATTTTIIDEETVQVTISNLKFLPNGLKDLTHTMLTGPSGAQGKLCLCTETETESKTKILRMWHNGFHYRASLADSLGSSPVLTIRNGKIVETNIGKLETTDTREWINKDGK